MNIKDLIAQSIFVGIYCVFLFTILSYAKLESSYLFFVLGFFKHFLGFFLGLHAVFCNCNILPKYAILFGESILEGVAFLILYQIFHRLFYKIWIAFTIGFILHILAEIFGLHKWFCEKKCHNAL
jgi:hypothetical protein